MLYRLLKALFFPASVYIALQYIVPLFDVFSSSKSSYIFCSHTFRVVRILITERRVVVDTLERMSPFPE